MLGAIFGDMVGSVYEFRPTKDYNFKLLRKNSHFTDDTVMTLAVAKAIMEVGLGNDDDTLREAIIQNMQALGRKYHDAGYGGHFYYWLDETNPKPYNSFGNGSGMRVSPVGWASPSLAFALHTAKLSAEVTHNHPEGIKGAQAVASAMYLARTGHDKEFIKDYIANTFHYDLDRTLSDIRPDYHFDVTCQGSVPEAIIAFLESHDYESAIRNAVSLGGDADTQASMAGAIAEAFYGGIPEAFKEETLRRLPEDLRAIAEDFEHYLLEGDPELAELCGAELITLVPPKDYEPWVEEYIDEE